ncbi:hypothetical protein AVV30_gp102 [Vibrio phage phi 1]|uniref:Uncharacterized protein n=1 Tax=Vibrio phage phi 1 TaxID=1589297 RepID=A0A0B5HE34_9CAUD|nr:hypothetical protein AVV30_gp102 [Vibrio phage phi 1]AJF40760.1 hypothetical protein SBVP1_0102 [Vibrio phage phi 1]
MRLIRTRVIDYLFLSPEPRLIKLNQRYTIGSGRSDYYFQWEPI